MTLKLVDLFQFKKACERDIIYFMKNGSDDAKSLQLSLR